MDVEAYLRDRRDHANRNSRQIKDYTVFDLNHVPDKPVTRKEVKQLIDTMLEFEVSRIPTHYAIIGSRGSGKTLSVKYLQRIMLRETELGMLYVNCRHHNTSFRIFQHLLPGRTMGFGLNELYERFLLTCPNPTVVVLDEVDLMSRKDKKREILYLLSRSEQPYMVIMLSNSVQVLKELDAATRSSLQPFPIHFKNYNAQQIQEILRHRAQRGLRSWKDGELAEIAALTTRLANSDARIAIKTLHYVVLQTQETVIACFEAARRDVVVDLICDLSDGLLMILWAAATTRSKLAKDIYKRYCRFSQQQREKPFSYAHFYSHLGYLQSVGLMLLATTKVNRTYTNRVALTFDESTAESIASLRFEQA